MSLEPLLEWMHLHPQWLLAAIAATAMVESLAMVGILVPGVALLFGLATVAGGSDISLLSCLLAAMVGAVAGDQLSFFLGRHAHRWALRHYPFSRHPQWVDRGERFFHRYGALSVVAGRFIGPIRPIIPFVAGMLSMPPRQFVTINLVSALLWAPVYLLPGYLVGSTAQAQLRLPEGFWGLFAILSLVILAGLTLLLITHQALLPGQRLHRLLVNLSPIRQGLLEPWRSPRDQTLPLPSLLLTLLCLTALTVLILVVRHTAWLQQFDQQILALMVQLRSEPLDQLVVALTLLGDGENLVVVALLLMGGLLAGRQPWLALHWLGGLALLALTSRQLKVWLQIPRPQVLLDPPGSYAFPSSHTSGSTVFFALLATAIALQIPAAQRWRCYLAASVPIILVGLSRLYLGVHWFSDVLGGVLLGLIFAGLTRFSYSRFDREPPRVTPALLVSLALALLYSAAYLFWSLDAGLARYALAGP